MSLKQDKTEGINLGPNRRDMSTQNGDLFEH